MRFYRRFGCLAFAVGAVLSTLAVAPTARADAESDAKDLFVRARDLRTKNDCAGAVPLFRKAYKVYPNGLGSLRNVAECEEAIGHYASSRRAWLDIKRALLTLPHDAKYDGWDKDAEDAAARLLPKVATVFVDVVVSSPEGESPAHERSGVHVFVNGENLGTNLVGTPLERDPGTYRIRVETEFAQPGEQEVSLGAGDSKHVMLRLVKTPPAAPLPEIDAGKGKRTAGWALVGLGAAALGGSVVTLLLRNSAESTLDEECPSHVNCAPSLKSTVDRGELMSTLTTILLPVGIVSASAGIAFVIWGANSKETAPHGSVASGNTLSVVPGLGRVDATWRF